MCSQDWNKFVCKAQYGPNDCKHETMKPREVYGSIIPCNAQKNPDGSCPRGLYRKYFNEIAMDADDNYKMCACCKADKDAGLSVEDRKKKRNREDPYQNAQLSCHNSEGKQQVKQGGSYWDKAD